jgi:hypothetical protein
MGSGLRVQGSRCIGHGAWGMGYGARGRHYKVMKFQELFILTDIS